MHQTKITVKFTTYTVDILRLYDTHTLNVQLGNIRLHYTIISLVLCTMYCSQSKLNVQYDFIIHSYFI